MTKRSSESFFSGTARLAFPAGLAKRIRKAYQTALRIPREDVSPLGCWIEDHALFLLEETESLRLETRALPRLPAVKGVPRLLLAARDIVRKTDLTAPSVVRELRTAWEEDCTQAELDSLPAALSLAMAERLEALLSVFQQEASDQAWAHTWAKQFSEGKREGLPGNDTLLGWALMYLSQTEDPEGLERADAWLRSHGREKETILREFQERQTEAGLQAERVIHGLQSVRRLPYDQMQERLSPVIRALRQDAAFCRMDAESRHFYVRCACRIAKKLRLREEAVARAAVTLAEGREGAEGEAGYYLIERPDLIAVSLLKRKKPSWALRHRTGLFLASLYGGAALVLVSAAVFGAPWYIWPCIVLCASEILRQMAYAVIRRFVPARMLPRLRVKKLSEETRTLVAVPCLLTSRKQAMRMARHMAVLRFANPDPYLDFMLLADFADSPEETESQDEEILWGARLSIDALNRRFGGCFYYLHRGRTWDASQQRFTGRERKRGALEALNRLLTEGACGDPFLYMSTDGENLKNRYAYVITLDADTFLPPGAAYELVGTMLHPLQKGRVGVVQPRMEVGADTVRTRTQKTLGGRGGADPYHLSVQDVYQDVFGKGSFVGKGIYEPAFWLRTTEGRLPQGRLLSHDLIEGETVGSALADDIVLYDSHPARLSGWQKRLHRWTRGDWQLLPFLKDKGLSLLSRHKIWDNLRRSHVPAAQVLLLLAGAGLNRPLLCLLALPWPLRGMGTRLALLPGKAYTQIDAAVRALYRHFVSHKNLLSWVTAAQEEEGKEVPLSCILAQLGLGAALTVLSLRPGGLWPLALAGMAQVAAPLLISWLDSPADQPKSLTSAQETVARKLARDTWHFFEQAVTADTLFLPPDNVQEDPEKGPAMRTSPTNIGLYLLSCCAAHELKIISIAEEAQRIADALSTLEAFQTWKGHFYNWYDLHTGEPMHPRFVSTVDSGNCMGCLLCCAQMLRNQLARLPEAYRNLPHRLDALAERMDFSALYDPQAHLFSIGWETEENKPTSVHYDSLASEARLTSFLAIMTGQVERRHWRYLNRAVTRAGGGPALLSWGGTLFEYLMPALLLPSTPETLLGESCRNAVRAQMAANPRRPFGISESGYFAFDPDLNYQYRAFGLPMLARSQETGGSVLAPYASLLAFPFFPRAVAENLHRMDALGWRDEHGFYEAADYSPQRVDSAPRIVKSHMAHHQGMILCALCNTLENQALVRAFMTLPAAQANAYLLHERKPSTARRRIELPAGRTEVPPDDLSARPAHSGLPPETQALHGGGMTWVLTPDGQGFLAADHMMITRFDDQAGAQTGPQFYLRDRESGAAVRPAVQGNAVFGEGMARYTLVWQALRVCLYCCTDPLSCVAVAMLHIENPGTEEREIEAVSFLEIAQGSREADEAHPNFRDLSVQVTPWDNHGLISRRLPRDEKDQFPLIGHRVVGDVFALRRQGDRSLFLGRSGSYAAPEQLNRNMEDNTYRTGDVIAPCLSLRAKLRVPAAGETQVCFLTAVGEKENDLNALNFSAARCRESFSLAGIQTKMTLHSLSMDGAMAASYRQMLGALLFRDLPHQAVYPSAARNALWRVGVSGALPVLLVLLLEGADQALIRHALRCHAWMRGQGISTDLIFFVPEETGYERPIRDQAVRLLSASPEREMRGVPGGVFLAEGDETQAAALESLARLTLKSGQPLKQQLTAIHLREQKTESASLTLPTPVPPLHLQSDNTFGGFFGDGGYCVKSPAPVPWHHILCSQNFGTLVCETGILQSYAGNSRLGRITRSCPDVHRGVPSEEIFLKENAGCLCPLTRCAALYEPGTADYRVLAGDILAETTVFAHAEKALGVRSVTLRCDTEKQVTLSWLIRFSLGEHPDMTRCRATEDFVFAQSGDLSGVGWAHLQNARTQALSSAVAFGCTGEEAPPVLFQSVHGMGSVAILEIPVTLRPREPVRLTMILGCAQDEPAARRDAEALLEEGAAAAERNVRALWEQRLSVIRLFGLEEGLERMMNRWLPYQVWTARLLARMGPYQPGGAFGFRDQLQDCLALLYTAPEFVRAHILLCAAHQFQEGDVQHWWHPPRRGVRTRISDDKLFLPFLTAQYVTVTGDTDILNEEIPYLLSAPLKDEEIERYEEPEASAFTEPLLAHCLRAIESMQYGTHGLPLMGGGDWNDGMNRVGGKTGESVWLGFFLCLVLKDFAPLCPENIREKYLALRRKLLDSAESAWTDAWYLRAWNDREEPIGGPDTVPPRIDLISQCFAVLSGAPRNHARTALANAVELLYDREAGIVKLLDPPFSPEENMGYIGAYLTGVRENGGQYTHAVPWLILALCRLGEYGLAWEIAGTILPIRHSAAKEQAEIYKIEPYVLAGDVYAGKNLGRGGWSWYTGSASWLYWAVLTALLGFEKHGSKARLTPHLPEDAEEFTVTYRFGSANYHFSAVRDTLFPTLDGVRLDDGWALLQSDGRTHEARYPIRS